jgi:hypothetical protein
MSKQIRILKMKMNTPEVLLVRPDASVVNDVSEEVRVAKKHDT